MARTDTEILRRIAERGLRMAFERDTAFVDIFNHMLDEIGHLEKEINLFEQDYNDYVAQWQSKTL